MTERSRFAEYRDEKRGGPPRELEPCGTRAAAQRHARRPEVYGPMCDLCAHVWRAHRAKLQRRRRAKKTA